MKNLSLTKLILACSILGIVSVFAGCKKKVNNSANNPTAKFEYLKFSDGKVEFTNKSTNATSYEWDFGDGETSTQQSPSHTYTKNGSYTVDLTAKNEFGNDKTYAYITISDIVSPEADFQYQTDTSFRVKFTNTSSNATSYEWDFGDGSTSTETNPTHTYSSRGIKTVTLTAYKGSATSKAHSYIYMYSQIKLVNQSNYPFSVTIDGIDYGSISGNSDRTFEVNPGSHAVYVEQMSGYTLWPTTRSYTLKCPAEKIVTQSFNTVMD